MIRVLVIEDDADFLDDIVFGLRHDGFEVSGMAEGCALDQQLADQPVDVLVLDLGLPGEDGLSIARRVVRTHPHLGIVMLTGRDSPRDRVIGLDSGADIYLPKTANRYELAAAIRAVSRRIAQVPSPKSAWILDQHKLTLTTGDGIVVNLTNQECLLMAVFSREYGGEASRRKLVEGLGGKFLDFDQRRLETLISRLRRKIEAESGVSGSIRAIRGDGYLFSQPLR